MVIRHGGLTAAERLKKAAEVCKQGCSQYCPYWTEGECRTLILTDCEEAIAERDERIAIMQESMETLEKRCNTLNALEQRCNALEALEKQNEPIAPEIETQNDIDVLYRCPACHKYLFYRFQKYCCICGQAVKWK